ncbi:MAG: sugar phosphate isomerase/epimerase [Caldilineaceae bacterium]
MPSTLKQVEIGCGQITWPRNAPEDQVLADIAQAGYAGAPAGLRTDVTAQQVMQTYQRFGLKPAPGYLSGDFWNPANEAQILENAKNYATFTRDLGCTELYVAAGGFNSYITKAGKTRSQIAGHVKPEDGMNDAEFKQFAKVLNQVCEILLVQGVQGCFHNHVGTPIETRAEIDHLFSLVDRNLVFLGPDTGHLAWAGDDVTAFCKEYASSIKTVHLKDCNPAIRAQGAAAEWNYATFSQHGIWTELGQGCVDFPAIFDILAGANFSGWLIVETDVTQLATPLESAKVSREYLKTQGL